MSVSIYFSQTEHYFRPSDRFRIYLHFLAHHEAMSLPLSFILLSQYPALCCNILCWASWSLSETIVSDGFSRTLHYFPESELYDSVPNAETDCQFIFGYIGTINRIIYIILMSV